MILAQISRVLCPGRADFGSRTERGAESRANGLIMRFRRIIMDTYSKGRSPQTEDGLTVKRERRQE
ncbi:MAG TPA: hypothetical protein DHV79_09665 [Lachnospiraceae bacterium]|nr:hypothetical protein [Lachnospiraceae bacterium]